MSQQLAARNKSAKNKKLNTNETMINKEKRERNKVNSLARALQLEHAIYHDETVMRYAALSDLYLRIDNNKLLIASSLVISFLLSLSFVTNSWTAAAILK
jgi:hypothetical protein